MGENKLKVFAIIILLISDMGGYKFSFALPPREARRYNNQPGTASKNSAPFPDFTNQNIFAGARSNVLVPKENTQRNLDETSKGKTSGSLIAQNYPTSVQNQVNLKLHMTNSGTTSSRSLAFNINQPIVSQRNGASNNMQYPYSSNGRSRNVPSSSSPFDDVIMSPSGSGRKRNVPSSSSPFDDVIMSPSGSGRRRNVPSSSSTFDDVIMSPSGSGRRRNVPSSSSPYDDVIMSPSGSGRRRNVPSSSSPFDDVIISPSGSGRRRNVPSSSSPFDDVIMSPSSSGQRRNVPSSSNPFGDVIMGPLPLTTSKEPQGSADLAGQTKIDPQRPSNVKKLQNQDVILSGSQSSTTGLNNPSPGHAVGSLQSQNPAKATPQQSGVALNDLSINKDKTPTPLDPKLPRGAIESNPPRNLELSQLGMKSYRQIQPKCAFKITEVYTGQPEKQFVELGSFCPKEIDQKQFTSLSGYYILMAAKESDGIRIFLLADLEGQYLVSTATGNNVQMYGIGSKTIPKIGLRFGKIDIKQDMFRRLQYADYPNEAEVISKDATLVLLVYVGNREKPRFRNLIKLPNTVYENKHSYFSLPFSELLKLELRKKVIDYILIGSQPNGMEDIIKDIQGAEFSKEKFKKQTVEISTAKHMSYSRCFDKTTSEFVVQHLPPTPMKENSCPLVRNFPYEIKYLLQRDSKKIIMNLIHGLTHAQNNPQLLHGSPIEVASKLIGINTRNLERIQKMGDQCLKDRKQATWKKWKQAQIDSFDRDKIRSIIAESFKKNVAPLFADIFKEFLDYKATSITYTTNPQMKSIERFLPLGTSKDTIAEIEKISSISKNANNDETDVEPSSKTIVVPGEKFACNSGTFAKVLYDLGFKYGLINNRVCLMQRSDLMEWRGSFVKTMMENERSPNRRKVTWLDETWIDPHVKWNRGWTLKNPKSIAECAQFSFRNLKVGKGPRLIVLAAGDEDGIIIESIKIRKISEADVEEDYHKNVNKDEFMRWFNGLMDTLDKRNEKHIIVIDNAPYHSALIAPKSTSRKAVLVEWFSKLRTMPDIGVHVPDTTGMNKKQLWEEVTKLKKNPRLGEVVYEIDEIAAKRGHTIVRLPPYHCMFNPIEFYWKDGKHEIAKQNANQNINELIKIAERVFKSYSSETWKKHVQHCKNLQAQYWKEDKYVEPSTTPFIIPLNVEDEDEFSDDEDDEDSCGSDNSFCLDTFDFDPMEVERDLNQGRQEVLAFQESMQPLDYPQPSKKRCKRKFIFPLDI